MLGGTAALLASTAASAALATVASAGTPAPAAAATPAATVSISVSAPLAADVLQQVNAVRRAHGLVPLKLSARLSAAAQQHSEEMGEDGYFEHDSADGSAFWKRIDRFYTDKGYGYWSVGENLLWASPDIDGPGALDLWMHSPEHRKNLLTARWREIGVSAVKVHAAPGTYHGLDVTIVTTDFGVRR
ncbi:MAG TPA: CAP domain-containing protein [Gaiellaceae bacterium]|nr:CAP domain-containing protein [Gaiellaceae bacterium]